MFLYHFIIWFFNGLFDFHFPTIAYDLLCAKKLISDSTSVLIGNLTLTSFDTTSDFLIAVEDILKKLEIHSSSPFTTYNRDLTNVLNQLYSVKTRVIVGRRESIIRRQPYGIIVAGPPGTGKTFGTKKLIKDLLLSINQPLYADDIVVLNENDEFQSEYRSNHKVVIFDDLGASRVSVIPNDPFRKIIDFINNVPKTALNPHLELKGNVWIRPDVVGCTTNLTIPFMVGKDNAQSLMCPDAINRRFQIMIYQLGFDEFVLFKLGSKYFCKFDDSMKTRAFSCGTMNYATLLEKVKPQFKEFMDEQTEFVQMVEDNFAIESFEPQTESIQIIEDNSAINSLKPESGLLYYSLIIQLQAVLRFLIASKSLKGDVENAAVLAAIRRFLAYDLQKIKKGSRKGIELSLKRAGYSPRGTREIIEWIEIILRGGTNGVLCLNKLDKLEATLECLTALLANSVVKQVSASYFPGYTTIYDMLTIIVPYTISRVNKHFMFTKNISNYFRPSLQPEGVSYKNKLNYLMLRGKRKMIEVPTTIAVSKQQRIRINYPDEKGNNADDTTSQYVRHFYERKLSLENLLRYVGSHYETNDFILLHKVALRNSTFIEGNDSLYYCKKTKVLVWLTNVKYTRKFRYNGWYAFLRMVAKNHSVFMLGFTIVGLTCAPVNTEYNSNIIDVVKDIISIKQVQGDYSYSFSSKYFIPAIRTVIVLDETERAAKQSLLLREESSLSKV